MRVALGNGLRPDVWRELIDRHGNQIHVCELYAATEGNIGFINVFNKFGCVGCLTPLYQVTARERLLVFAATTCSLQIVVLSYPVSSVLCACGCVL